MSVIIPTLGRSERLDETLASLTSCRPRPDEIVVVDGLPSETSRVRLEALGARSHVPVVYVPSEPGLTVQRNVGLRAASSDVVLFVDDDMEFGRTPDFLSHLVRQFERSDVVGATGVVIETDQRRRNWRRSRVRRFLFGRKQGTFTRYGYPRYVIDTGSEVDVEFMNGGLCCVRRDVALKVGFDETLTGYAVAEDEDFSYRLSRHGRIRFVPDVVVEHHRFGRRNDRAVDRSLVVNRAYLLRKNFPATAAARLQFWLFVVFLMGHRLSSRNWAGFVGLCEGAIAVARGESPLARADRPGPLSPAGADPSSGGGVEA
ncbi:MAG TPA: glycosyltransferase family 2 protein [Gaiellaceae bacterium]|nr:glycosyltransferase family 2 protein [Gaiellaceae bacterium]